MQIYLQEPVRNLTALRLSDPLTHAVYWTIVGLKQYYTPCIISGGIVGNLVSCVALRGERFRQVSAVPYMVALGLFDSVFLAAVLAVWLSRFGLDLYNSACWCELLTYSTYTCGFLSVWLNFCLAVDRVTTVYSSPTRVKKICTPLKAKLTIIAFVVVAITVFLNVSLLYGLIHTRVGTFCIMLPQFGQAMDILSKMDMAINFVLPYTTMAVLIVVTLVRTRKLRAWRRSLMQTSERHAADGVDGCVDGFVRLSRLQREVSVPACLFGTALLVLSSPGQLLRLASTLTTTFTESRFLWQQLCLFLMFTRAALTFPILVCSSGSFRSTLCSPVVRLLARPSVVKNDDVHPTLAEFSLRTLSSNSVVTQV